MELASFHSHAKAMEIIEAQEMLKQFRVASFPNMKEDAQSRLHRDLHKRAFPIQKVFSFDDIDNIFGGKGAS